MVDKVAIYLRKSRDEDNEAKEETLARHEKMLNDYCKRNKLNVVAIYKEVVSGESIANRPEMQRLLEDVNLGLYTGVVCIEIERLSRGNQIDQCEILEVFKKSNTKIYTLQKIYDLSKEEIDEEFFEFSLFMSRREYKIIRRRMERGRAQAMKEGYYTGSITPYGYTKVKDGRGFVLVADPKEAEIVRLIFEKYAGGDGILTICRYLNDKGILTRKGCKWGNATIRQILTNPTHIGKINVIKRDDVYEGKHEGIIDVETFNTVQAILNSHETKVKGKQALKNPLATILKCGICGRVMRRCPNGRGSYVYRCITHGCKNRRIVCPAIETALLEKLKTELKDFNYLLDNYEDELKSKRQKRDEEIEIISKEIEKQHNAINVACEMLESGVYTKELFTKRTNIIEGKLKELNAQLTELENLEIKEDERANKALPILSKVIDKYDTLDAKEKNNLLKKIIKSIDYTRLEDDFILNVELLI
jgi:DNA invertase Pin-like site-specific DNA recombinase